MARKLSLRKLVTLPSFYWPNVSWSRDKIAFFDDASGRIELSVLNVSSATITQISHGQLPKTVRMPAVWSRSDRELFVLFDHDGDEQFDIYAFDLETAAFTAVTESVGQNYPLEFSPDNTQLLFISTRNGQMNLFLLSLVTKEVSQLTSFTNPVFGGVWSPDGTWIYFPANETPDLRNFDIYRICPDGSGLEKFWSLGVGSREDISEISPNGKYLGVNSDQSGINQAGVMDIVSREIWWLGDTAHEELSPRFSPDGSRILTTQNTGATFTPRLYDFCTRELLPELELPTGFVASGQFLQDGQLFFTHSDPTHRPRMVQYNPESREMVVLKDAEYGSINRSDFATAEYLSYPSFDGQQIFGILWKPKEASALQPVPVVIFIHGGPGGQDVMHFGLEAQVLCSRGFAVFQPNYRSSSGYGKEFFEANLNDWGGGDLQDIIYAAKYLGTVPWIYEKRISVAGGSYGGYLTYMAAVKTPELWRACIAWVGITDLQKLYENSMPHFKYSLQYFMGDPEKNQELWRDRSAITHAANFMGPLLIVHGISDPRCPIEQARIFRDKLLELGFVEGIDFEYNELGEEGHGSTDPEQNVRIFELLTDFLERRG